MTWQRGVTFWCKKRILWKANAWEASESHISSRFHVHRLHNQSLVHSKVLLSDIGLSHWPLSLDISPVEQRFGPLKLIMMWFGMDGQRLTRRRSSGAWPGGAPDPHAACYSIECIRKSECAVVGLRPLGALSAGVRWWEYYIHGRPPPMWYFMTSGLPVAMLLLVSVILLPFLGNSLSLLKYQSIQNDFGNNEDCQCNFEVSWISSSSSKPFRKLSSSIP